VPKLHRGRKYRTPTTKEQNQIFFIGHELEELFPDEEIMKDILKAARLRAIGEFFYATEKNPRYKPGSDRRAEQRTDNYIWSASSKLKDLAKYVRTNMHRPFITVDQLPPELAELRTHLVDVIIQRAQHDALMQVLVEMRHHEIWYDEGVGIWQVCQTSMDDFHADRKEAKAKVPIKADMRPFHGRVRSQSKNRGIPAGVSVSFA
jgi:hypothetical protein